MKTTYDSIKKGLTEAIAYSEGKKIEVKEFKPLHIDVKELRKRIGMTQPTFASSIGISLGTLRHWERGDRYPQGPALVLLNLIEKNPKTIFNVLNS